MLKRLIPLVLVTLCALPLATAAPSGRGAPGARDDAQVSAVDTSGPDVSALTDFDREAFQLAQHNSDPRLGDQRGGFLGFVILVLLIILIVVLVD